MTAFGMNTKCICLHHKHFSGKIETENQVVFPGYPPFTITLKVVQSVECTDGPYGLQGTPPTTQTGANSWTIDYGSHKKIANCKCKYKGDSKCHCEQTLTVSHSSGYATGWGKDLVNGVKSKDTTLTKAALDQAAEEAWDMCDEPIPGGGGGGKSPKQCCKLMNVDKFGK